MEFITRLVKAAACYFTVLFVLIETGVPVKDAKLELISIIYFWGFVFYFLHPYMPFIAVMETFPQRGYETNNVKGAAWRFSAWLTFISGGICWLRLVELVI